MTAPPDDRADAETPPDAPLHRWSARRLARALATGELSALDLADALLARSAAREPSLRAWAHLDPAAARRQAGALDRQAAAERAAGRPLGALHGLPLGVKDNLDTAGLPTAYGSPIYAGHVPACDAACVALARGAGAWVLGKTACTEFANMSPAPTRHPLDAPHRPRHTPGGSSSGSAAAVAAGLVPLALGTQTAGSVIRPAAYCGVVGYKPSPRRIPRAGAKPNSDTLDEVGVFARNVGDAAWLARALGGLRAAQIGADGAAPAAEDPRAAAVASSAGADRAPRLALTLTSRQAALSPAMASMLDAAAQRLTAAGAGAQPLRPSAALTARFDALFDAQRTVQLAETARALAPEWLYRRRRLSTGLRRLIDAGLAIDPRAYAAALAAAEAGVASIDALWGGAEVLIAPAAPGAAPADRRQTGDPLFSRPWQLLGCPSLTLPGGLDADGLPLGLQLVARPGDDAGLFAAAAWVERVLGSRAISEGRALD